MAKKKFNINTGFPSPAESFHKDPLDVFDFVMGEEESTFFMNVSGNIPSWDIKEDDILVVNRAMNPNKNDLVIAILDEELILTQFLNKKNLNIWGVVSFVIRKRHHGIK